MRCSAFLVLPTPTAKADTTTDRIVLAKDDSSVLFGEYVEISRIYISLLKPLIEMSTLAESFGASYAT